MTTDKINILVVDDLPENLVVMESVLEGLGENVVPARSGAEALQQVLVQDFAVILLDVNMPDLDGFETAALIRKRKKSAHVPIIFMTAYADEMHKAQGYSLGAVDFILSPVVPEILCTKVKVFVDLSRMTQQVKRQAEERIVLMQEQAARAAAEESNRRLGFLAKAGNVLGRSLDYTTTARDAARLAVPVLADLSVVTLVGQGEDDWRTVVARVDEEGTVVLEEFTGRAGLPAGLGPLVERALANETRESRSNPEAPIPSDASSTALVLPLQARNRTIGVLALAQVQSARPFSLADQTIAEALASRAAVALDNARLYSDVQRADRQKNEFLSMLAHELRNPLTPIRNAVQILCLRDHDPGELQWAREVIGRQVTQLVRLVDDLLDVSRITQGKIRLIMQPVAVESIVAQAVETSRPLIDSRKHHLQVALPPKPLWVCGDTVRLAQVLTNLLNNAAKYTDEGGKIWLTVGNEEEQVVLGVRDTGVGIPQEMLGSVFELFTQVDRSLDRSQGGLGIGLTLVRHLIQMHGGTVQALSPGPNQGSEFVIRLPALAPPEKYHPPANGQTRPDQAKAPGKILVVDDNRDAAVSLAMLLRLDGYEVRTAYDGPGALEVAGDFRPGIVLLDIGLPGMDGYEVARRLRQNPDLTGFFLVAVTGYSQQEDRRRSKEAGFDHYMVKPVDPQVLSLLLASQAMPSQHIDQTALTL